MSPFMGGVAETVDYSYFDRARLHEPKVLLFQTPVGMNGKSALETNMMMGGQLPAPQKFSVERIRASLLKGSALDMVPLSAFDPQWSRTTYDLRIGRKLYNGGDLLSIVDPILVSPTQTKEAREKLRPRLKYPLPIECGEWMAVEVYTQTPADDLWIQVNLDGILERAVQ